MISSIITPVRWYTDIHESDRFSSECDIHRFELISDKTRLLPFQFRRPRSPYGIAKWFLRKECVGPTSELLSVNDSLFTYDTSFWTKTKFTFSNGKINTTGGGSTGNLSKTTLFTIGKYYDITIVVNEFVKAVASTFSVTYDIAGSGVVAITETGTITFRILATATDLTIDSVGGTSADYITIESIKINEYVAYNALIGDVKLDEMLLNLYSINLESDLIQYCGDSLPTQIPCGKYYMIISTDDNVLFYSELITVKDFIPSRSPFTLLEWSNSCDLSDVFYQNIGGCSYKNRMYIDSELLKPEYPFKDEGEEDGNFKLNILFQKWEKKQSLLVAKCPEFIVDALTAIRLHDSIEVTKPLRKQQTQVLAPIEIDKLEYTNTSVFSECATNVELVLFMKDKIVDSTCCTNIEMTSCYDCQYTVDSIDVLTGEYYFGLPEDADDFGLYHVIDSVYTLISNADDIVCVTDTGLKYINTNAEYWQVVPSVTSVVDTDLGSGNHSYLVKGFLYPNTYAKIRAVIYDADLGTTTTINYTDIYEQSDLTTGVTILSSTFGGADVPVNGSVSFFIENYSLNCSYGYSQAYDVYYPSLHAKVSAWVSTLTIKPSVTVVRAFNIFIQGLDDDAILDEFDLLHVTAGLSTNEQRLRPIITTGSTNFIAVNSPTLDASGIKGNGASSYVDLKFNPSVSGVKLLRDDASFGVYINDNPTPGVQCDMGLHNVGQSVLYSRKSGNILWGAVNSTNIDTQTNTDSTGLYACVRTSSMAQEVYKNAVSYGVNSVASEALDNYNYYLGARNLGGVADRFSDRTIQLVFIGSSSINQTILSTRFNTLKTALGF